MSRPPGGQFAALRASNPQRAAKIAKRLQRYDLVPHEGGQDQVDASRARFEVLCAGRRWGKTQIGARKALKVAKRERKTVWWVANTYKNVRRGYRAVLRQTPPSVFSKAPPPATADGRQILQFKWGTRMEFYSAENADAMVGEGVDYIVIDEAALCRSNVWNQVLRPTLLDTGGGAIFISTPRGLNWFKDLYDRGQDPNAGNWASWRFPSYTNPYLDAKEVEDMRRDYPSQLWEQEVEALFISNAAAVFRIPEGGIIEREGAPRGHVVMGIDLAKHQDFTVLSAARLEDRVPCFHERFHDVSWPEQKERIISAVRMLERLGCTVTVVVDSTGIGDVVFDDLEEVGLDVTGVKFTAPWKALAVRRLSADLERGNAYLLPEQRDEFMAYRYRMLESGTVKYAAEEGQHDDEVSAKLLEHWGLVQLAAPDVRLLSEGPEPDDEDEGELVELPSAPDSPVDIMARPEVWS